MATVLVAKLARNAVATSFIVMMLQIELQAIMRRKDTVFSDWNLGELEKRAKVGVQVVFTCWKSMDIRFVEYYLPSQSLTIKIYWSDRNRSYTRIQDLTDQVTPNPDPVLMGFSIQPKGLERSSE